MARKITTSLCWAQPLGNLKVNPQSPVALFAAWLDNGGSLHVVQQSTTGVWATVNNPPKLPSSGVALKSLAGVPNYLVALGADGTINISTFTQASGWSQFITLPTPLATGNIKNAPTTFDDFAAALTLISTDVVLVIVGTKQYTDLTDAGFYAFILDLTASSGAIDPTASAWVSIAQASSNSLVTTASSPALINLSIQVNPEGNLSSQGVSLLGAVGLTVGGPSPNPGLIGFTTVGSHSWQASTFGPIVPGGVQKNVWALGLVSDLVVTQGATGQANQAIAMNNGVPMLCYDYPPGTGKTWNTAYGSLLPSNVQSPPYFTYGVAAGIGNGGNLQVVIIGVSGADYPGLPYLFWQDTSGNWSLFQFDSQTGGPFGALNNGFTALNVFTQDLAIGMGWCEQGAALQVCYLGTDGKAYVSWQNPSGQWFWYAGLTGQGLP